MTEDLPTADPGTDWLDRSCAAITAEPDQVTRAFALAARRVGREPQRPDVDPTGVVHGTVDDAARARLVVALADAVGTGPDLVERLTTLYRQGDGAERRGVLRGLDALAAAGRLAGPDGAADALVAAGLELAADALRANDPALVASAVGPFGSAHLDQHTWRHGVLKLVFQGTSLDAVHDLTARADTELDRMARDFAAERRAAGRTVPADLGRLSTAIG